MAEVNVTLVVLLVVTGVAIMLLWREAMRVLRASKQNESAGQKRGFVRRVTDYDEVLPDTSTQGDVDARFEAARMKEKGSLIRDMANQSPWKDAPPSAELAKSMSDEIEEVEDDHIGRMTIPSREIALAKLSNPKNKFYSKNNLPVPKNYDFAPGEKKIIFEKLINGTIDSFINTISPYKVLVEAQISAGGKANVKELLINGNSKKAIEIIESIPEKHREEEDWYNLGLAYEHSAISIED